MSKEWFKDWFSSPYHSILYDKRDRSDAETLIHNLVKYLDIPKQANIFDIACGSGRFALPLADLDFQVVGIDLSEKSIIEAKKHERNNLTFYVHDMRVPFRTNYFDYVFNFFTSFGYFDKFHDNELAARAFAKALKPGGTLVIDYLNAKKVKGNLVTEESVKKKGVHFDINRHIASGKIIKNIKVTDGNNSYEFQESVSAFVLDNFKQLFENEGMRLIHYFGDYQLQEFDDASSPRLIMVFQKS